ncbi:hypothetical protein SDJN03_22258, partial [Cucurbita argyrosperma subsp. sororia]
MLRMLRSKLRRLYSRLWWLIWKHPKRRVIIKRFGKMNVKGRQKGNKNKARVYTKSQVPGSVIERPFRVATFNVAMFSLAPAVPIADKPTSFGFGRSPVSHCPKSILKQSPLDTALSKPKVSINLPDNEISLAINRLPGLSKSTDERYFKSQVPVRSPVCFPFSISNWHCEDHLASGRTILEVLKEAGADILALQDVKAEESKGMKPLSDLAAALGMHYVFAESWAPEYGNAVLSKWPIKRWNVQKIADDDDFSPWKWPPPQLRNQPPPAPATSSKCSRPEPSSSTNSDSGKCNPSNKVLVVVLAIICALFCILSSFTDSYVGPDGTVNWIIHLTLCVAYCCVQLISNFHCYDVKKKLPHRLVEFG